MDKMNKNYFYVYGYTRSRKSKSGDIGTFYYIGKGQRRRAYQPHLYVSIPKNKENIVIISKNLSEIDAFQAEILLIYLWGRKSNNTGILLNRTEGGEGVSGFKHKEEDVRRILNNPKRIAALKGRKFSEAGKAALSAAHMGKPKGPMSQETKDKIGRANSGKSPSAEARQKMSLAKKGRKLTPEHRSKIGKGRERYRKRLLEESICVSGND